MISLDYLDEALPDGGTLHSSHSNLSTFRDCPQKWLYRYGYRLDRAQDSTAAPLDFGSWWHAVRAADSIRRGRAAGTLIYCPATLQTSDDGPTIDTNGEISADTVIEDCITWWEGLPIERRNELTEFIGQAIPARLSHIFNSWRERWRDDHEHEEVLAVEVPWHRNVKVPGGSPSRLRLSGIVDEIVRDKRRGIVIIRDAKTSKDLSRAQGSLDDMMDSQLQIYSWGIAPTLKKWQLPAARAISYDRVRSTAPKTPQITKAGSLSKAVTDYDLETYLYWCHGGVPYEGTKKDGSGAGVYEADQAVVDKLSTPEHVARYLRRTLTPVNPNMVKAHLIAAVDSAADIQRTADRSRKSGEAPRNLSRSCSWCDYADLCRAQLIGGPRGHYDPDDYGLRQKRKRVDSSNTAASTTKEKRK